MSGTIFRDVVSKSGLVPLEKIVDVFQVLAIAADEFGGLQCWPRRATQSIHWSTKTAVHEELEDYGFAAQPSSLMFLSALWKEVVLFSSL